MISSLLPLASIALKLGSQLLAAFKQTLPNGNGKGDGVGKLLNASA